GREGEK
ncbi:trna a64-2-o-ribosylphosphate transferase, partial [Nannochloropsis oceanica]